MERTLVPAELEFLIHCHAHVGQFDGLKREAPVLLEARDRFLQEGIIRETGDDERPYETTKKGDAWVVMICSTPQPVSFWCDPRTSEPGTRWRW